MITPELQTYIRQQLGAGIAKDVIKQGLVAKGWNVQDLDDAFFAIENEHAAEAATPPVGSTSHKGIWVTVIILILLLLGTAGAYAAYSYSLFTLSATTSPLVATTTESSAPITDGYLPRAPEAPLIANRKYACDQNKALDANFYEDKVSLKLIDSGLFSTIDLPQVGGPIPITSADNEERHYQFTMEGDSTYNSYIYVFLVKGSDASLTISAEISSTTPARVFQHCAENL